MPLAIALPDGEAVNTRIYEKAKPDVFSVPPQHPGLIACGADACLKPAIRITPPAISSPVNAKPVIAYEDNVRLTFYLGRLHATLLFYSRTAVRKLLGCHCREEHVDKLSHGFMPELLNIFRHNPEAESPAERSEFLPRRIERHIKENLQTAGQQIFGEKWDPRTRQLDNNLTIAAREAFRKKGEPVSAAKTTAMIELIRPTARLLLDTYMETEHRDLLASAEGEEMLMEMMQEAAGLYIGDHTANLHRMVRSAD